MGSTLAITSFVYQGKPDMRFRIQCVLLACIGLMPASMCHGSEPIDIGSRRELFVDHYLIDQLDGVALKLHPPQSKGPAIRFDKPWGRLASGKQRCIGNEQIVSKWPCRSGVLIEGDKLYTTAGMWSEDGVIIYCLSADTGEVIWKNDTTGYRWMLLPHGSGYGGVAPQGYLALYKGTLYVAAGRSAPAIFDASTGKLLFHEIRLGYKAHYPGGSWIMAAHDWIMFRRQHNYKLHFRRSLTSELEFGIA